MVTKANDSIDLFETNGSSPPERIAGYRVHPAAGLFPLMEEAELQELANDIKANGQQEPIRAFQSPESEPSGASVVVLDGRNRLLACERAGVKPYIETETFLPDDPVTYVVTRNLHRRHLTAEQRAAIVIKAAALSGKLARLQAEAKEREQAGTLASREAWVGKTAAKLAEQSQVSRATVERVQTATRDNPEALDAIASGKMTSAKLKAKRQSVEQDTAPREADPEVIEKWRTAWASLNVTEADVAAVERAVETWLESLRVLRAVQKRVLDVYPKRAPEIGPAAPMGGNLGSIGKAFRRLFETDGVGNGYLATPTPGG
jgi:ParB-like chromosome segregation protein Spo0J